VEFRKLVCLHLVHGQSGRGFFKFQFHIKQKNRFPRGRVYDGLFVFSVHAFIYPFMEVLFFWVVTFCGLVRCNYEKKLESVKKQPKLAEFEAFEESLNGGIMRM